MIPESYLGATTTISRVVDHFPGRRTIALPRLFTIAPGQFVMLWLPGIDEKPFSASELTTDEIEITICDVGPTSHALLECQVGERIGLRGPFGNGFRVEPDAVLVGGGMGAAPIRYLARELARQGLPPTVLIGARRATELIFSDDFLAQGGRLFTDDGSAHEQGLATDALPELLDSGAVRTVCACGPEPMLLAVKELCDERGVDYQLAFERYMKCGIGICGSCSLDGSGIRVCVEGPVLGPAALSQVTDLGRGHRGPTGAR